MSGKRVAIVQSNYIPWKGYFDLINSVDEFILYDDVQYTRRDWRNRNMIKTKNGLVWLSIPVQVKGRRMQTIKETVVSDDEWRTKHWQSIVHNYARSYCFEEFRSLFESLYLGYADNYLSRINYRFISAICDLIGISTKLSWSMDYQLTSEGKTERLIALCIQAGASEYVSGPSAAVYLDVNLFRERNIKLSFTDYSGYPEYRQLFPPFTHYVSILDLLFNEGENAGRFMRSFKQVGN